MKRPQALDSARQLVVSGASYEEAAAKTGIPQSTLEKRGARDGWTKSRSTAATYLSGSMAFKHELLELARTAMREAGNDATLRATAIQLHQQWLAMEKAFPEHRYTPTESDPKAKLAAGVDVLELLLRDYLPTKDRNTVTALAPHVEGFTAWLADHYGA